MMALLDTLASELQVRKYHWFAITYSSYCMQNDSTMFIGNTRPTIT